jgi:hypothetical protein
VACCADGTRLITGAGGLGSGDKTAIIWDARTGLELHTLSDHSGPITSVAFSADGNRVLTGSWDKSAILWDAHTGEKLHTFTGHTSLFGVSAVALSRDGGQALTGADDQTAILWDTRTGEKLRTLSGHSGAVRSVAFSPDGGYVLTGSSDTTAIVWDTRTGQELRTLSGHSSELTSVTFSPDNRRVLTASADGTARLWDIATGEELGRLVSLDRGAEWLVSTPEGLFDGSEGGRQNVMYRVGGELSIVPVDRFFQDFYTPGLLSAIWRGERPRPTVRLGASLPPVLKVVSTSRPAGRKSVTVNVEVADQGGGVQGPFLRHNGARVPAAGEKQKVNESSYRQSFSVALVEGENRLRVEAASADGSWESEPAEFLLNLAPDQAEQAKPVLHLLAVGVEQYAEAALRLHFAADDARALVRLFETRGPSLYAEVRPQVLINAEVTRDHLRAALQRIAETARPQDMLLVFISGHGVTVGQRYYVIPHDMRIGAETLEEDVREGAVPGDVLADWMGTVPALKRILILDTCHSGAAVALAGGRGRDPFAFRGAVERLSRTQGIFTLAASAADEAAAEVPSLKHGILSYALLAGLKAIDDGPLAGQPIRAANQDQVVDVLEWFSYASGHVPRLSKRFTGQHQTVEMHGRGEAFPVLPLE